MPNLEELALQGLVPLFLGFIPYKRRTNLETKLLELRHMSRPKFFYLGLPNSNLKPTFLNVCGLHMIPVHGFS